MRARLACHPFVDFTSKDRLGVRQEQGGIVLHVGATAVKLTEEEICSLAVVFEALARDARERLA